MSALLKGSKMAGNQTDARREAERQLNTAKKGGNKKDIAAAQANFDSKRREELDAMGKNETARSWF